MPPPALTRLVPLHEKTGGPVADTGTSALLGALCDSEVMDRSFREGITVINVGNGHTVAALVYRGQVRGIYEHHTGMRDLEQLLHCLLYTSIVTSPDWAVISLTVLASFAYTP